MKYFTHKKQRPYSSFISEKVEYFTHQHDQIELIYILSGTVTYTTPDSCCTLHSGQLSLQFPYFPHGFSCIEPGSRILTILFDIDFIPDFTRRFCEYLMPENIFTRKEADPSTHQTLNWLLYYTTNTCDDSPETLLLKQRGWLTAILGDLFYKHPLIKRTENLEPEIIREIIHYMEDNIERGFTQEELASALGISQHYLTHSLKPVIFKTYNMLLTFIRIKHANRLLAETNLSFLEIALSCGFPNLSTFTRNYKKITGITPSEFRRQMQAAKPEK